MFNIFVAILLLDGTYALGAISEVHPDNSFTEYVKYVGWENPKTLGT